MKPPVFIVSTGRCGSTMMSDVVRLHPRLLSLSEFFVSLSNRSFARRSADGEQFWDILNRLSPTVSRMFASGSASCGSKPAETRIILGANARPMGRNRS